MNRRTLLGSVAALTAGGCLGRLPGREPHVDVPCPTPSENADSLCTHTGADPELALRPSAWRLDGGSDVSLTATLSNDTDETARVSIYPILQRYADGESQHVWPPVVPPLEKRLDSGETYAWKLLFGTDGSAGDADEAVYLYALDPGKYELVVGAELSERTVNCVTAFEVGDGG